MSESKKEDIKGEDYTYGLRSGPHNSGLNSVMGRIVVSGLANFKIPPEQVMDTHLFQVRPNITSVAKLGKNK